LNKPPDYVLDQLSRRIAGDIVLSNDPGRVVRKWREIYGFSQQEVAEAMGVKASVLSDYERGRRLAGRGFVNRYVDTLFKLDSIRGWRTTLRIAKLLNIYVEGVLDIGEFTEPLSLDDLLMISKGVLLSSTTEHRPVLGYTVLDSVRAVQSLTANEYVRLMGSTSDRVVVFTNITRGRSVMVAVRVSSIKPSVVVLHGVSRVDPLAIRIACIEEMPLISTDIDLNMLIKGFRSKTLV